MSVAHEDEGAVPMLTTPFPDVVRITLTPGVYPGFTAPPGAGEIVGGGTDTLSPLPIPPSVTDQTKAETPVVHEPRPELTDAAMAPTGELLRT